jgi:hypothetical protein
MLRLDRDAGRERAERNSRRAHPDERPDEYRTGMSAPPTQPSLRDLPHGTNVDGSNLLVNLVQRSLIHKLHANSNVGIRDERAAKRNEVRRIEIVHDLQVQQDLFPY